MDSKNYALCMISKCYIKFVMIEDQALTINIYPILVCLFLINLPLHCCTCGFIKNELAWVVAYPSKACKDLINLSRDSLTHLFYRLIPVSHHQQPPALV